MATYAQKQSIPPQQQQQQSSSNAPQRIPSFVGLPPIRRASTFGSSLLSLDSPGGFSVESDTSQPQSGAPAAPFGGGAPRSSSPPPMSSHPGQALRAQGSQNQFTTGPPPPGLPVQHVYRPTQVLAPSQPPNGAPGAQVPPRSLAGGPAVPHSTVNGAAPQGGQGPHPPFAATGMGSRPPMMPPHMMMNHSQRLPPQDQGWNLQESHLSEPLNPSNRHRSSPSNSSSQQPFYGYDKEAGVPSTTSLLSENDKGDETEEETPPNPPQPNQNSGPPPRHIGQALTTNNKSIGSQEPLIPSLSRSSTSQSDLHFPGPGLGNEDARGRRQSSIFAGIRGKLGGASASEDNRRDAFGAPKTQGVVASDGASEAGIVIDESGQPKKRLPFSRLRNAENISDNMAPHSQESIIAQGPGTPSGESDVPQSPFPPPEKKRSFFGGVGGPAPAMLRKERSDTSRMSVSSTAPTESGNGNGVPKKGFSALFGKLRPGNGAGNQEGPQGFGPSGGPPPRNSLPPAHGQQQFLPGPGQSPPGIAGPSDASAPDLIAPPPIIGRGRGDSTSSGRSVTFAPTQSSQTSFPQQGMIGDVDKGRKPSGGLFGFGKMRKSDMQAPEAIGQRPFMGSGPPSQAQPAQGSPSQVAQAQILPGQPGQGPESAPLSGPVPPGQGLPEQMGRGLSPSDQVPAEQMGRGQSPPEQARPVSMGRGQALPDRPESMGRGQPPVDQARPTSMGRGLAPLGQIGPGSGQQQFGRGQLPPFAPGLAPFPGQYGMQALGPDGRPIILAGQFNPQTGQFMVLLPPGVAPPPNGMVPGMRPMMPGQLSQLSLLPPLPESRPSSQHGDLPAMDRRLDQANGVHSSAPLLRSVSGAQQDSLKVDQQTPPGSRSHQADSPVSQRSQAVSVSTQDQSRGSLSTTPVQYRQAFPPPPPSAAVAAQPQGFGPALVNNQMPARKPVQTSPISPADQLKPQEGSSEGGPRGQRSSSISSQSRFSLSGGQGSPNRNVNADQSRRVSGTSSVHRLSAQQPSPMAVSAAAQPPPTALASSGSPQPSLQGPQQPNMQYPGPVPVGQPGAPFFAPGQGPPANPINRVPSFASTVAAPAGPQPGQGFPPSGLRPPGTAMAAPKEKEQSTFSKLLKGTKTSPSPQTPGQEKPEKKSFFGFRRESKQPAAHAGPHQAQPQAGQVLPPAAQLLRPQMTGPLPTPMHPLRPQMTGPQPITMQPLRPQMTGPPGIMQSLRPQMTGPQPLPMQPLRPQMTGPQPQLQPFPGGAMPIQPFAIPLQAGRGAVEPQYAQVPIPAGYGYVHGEGSTAPAPAPYFAGAPVGFAVPPGQPINPAMPQHPMWSQGVNRPVWAAPLPGQPILQPRPVGLQDSAGLLGESPAEDQQSGSPQGQDQPIHPLNGKAPAQPTGGARQVVAPEQTQSVQPIRPVQPTQPAQPTPVSPQPSLASQLVSPASVTSPEGQYPVRPEYNQPTHGSGQGSNPALPPQLRHPSSPQGYPIPHSAFSPINPAANKLSNPPLPQGGASTSPGQNRNSGGLVPQRQPSAVSQISLQPGSLPHGFTSVGQSPNTPSPQVTPDRAVSPEPVHGSIRDSRNVSPEQPSQPFSPPNAVQMQVRPPQGTEERPHRTSQYSKHAANNSRGSLQVQPQTPRNAPEDNIYDATPRHSTVPPQYREDVSKRNSASTNEPKSPGPSQGPIASRSPESTKVRMVPSPIERSDSVQTLNEPNLVNSRATVVAKSSIANGTDTPPKANSTDRELFEEAKRQRLLREQEEKIPVFPTEPDMNAAANPAKKEDEEEPPQMSATSYPGQEWNPYEAGYGDWDD